MFVNKLVLEKYDAGQSIFLPGQTVATRWKILLFSRTKRNSSS